MPATLSFSAKCANLFSASFDDGDDKEVAGYSGYVPAFFPDQHYGDYVMLDIDLATGQIKNWQPPTL
jgi:hypothetical protein